jgi:hypothetical protein
VAITVVQHLKYVAITTAVAPTKFVTMALAWSILYSLTTVEVEILLLSVMWVLHPNDLTFLQTLAGLKCCGVDCCSTAQSCCNGLCCPLGSSCVEIENANGTDSHVCLPTSDPVNNCGHPSATFYCNDVRHSSKWSNTSSDWQYRSALLWL